MRRYDVAMASPLPPSTPRTPASRCLRAAGLLLLTSALALPTGPAAAVEPLRQHDLVLLQSGAVLERRVDNDAFAAYTRALGAAADDVVRAHPRQLPTAGFLVVVARPGGGTHAWLDFKPPLAEDTEQALTRSLEAVTPMAVKEGPVVVALRVSVWGAREPAAHAPAPEAWRAAGKRAGHPLPLDQLIDEVWPK